MEKRYFVGIFVVAFVFLLGVGTLIVVIDPFFHYHKPLKALSYRIYKERYQNDGIIKHFDYDAIITGTSTSENFKTSEMDRLFNTNAVKIPFAGAGLKEIHDTVQRAIQSNPDLKIIVWGLDYHMLFKRKDYARYDHFPIYLYDNNLWNDIEYVLNGEVFLRSIRDVIYYTIKGGHTTSFDDYSNWNAQFKFGKEAVIPDPDKSRFLISKTETPNFESIEENILNLVIQNPQIDFYFFWAPYNIAFFDAYHDKALTDFFIGERETLEMILPYDNVHFFSFFDDFDVITNFDNFKDVLHYHEKINSHMLECMAKGVHQVTLDNYDAYCQRVWDFYTTYDYDAIYK